MLVLPRPHLATYTDEDWKKFFNILHLLRTTESSYKVILEDTYPGNSSLVMRNVTIYDFFVWVHHYANENSDPNAGTYVSYVHS